MKGSMTGLLVTGANGFIGRAVCVEALRRGLQIKGALRGDRAMPEGVQTTEVGEIGDETDWRAALSGVDTVIHTAARVHVMNEHAADPLAEFRKVNVLGTANLARQAALAGVRRFVYVSSIKVNGEGTFGNRGYSAEDEPSPVDPYGVSKWEAEQALWHIAGETGLEVVVVRPPLVYGPGVKGNFISLMTAVSKGIPLPLAGVENARSLVYLGNLVDALIVCATHPAAAGRTYLISDGMAVSTGRLMGELARALGCPNRVFYFPPLLMRAAAALLGRSAQVDRLLGSLRVNDEALRLELKWLPPYTFEQGLQATATWYLEQRKR